MKNHLIPRFLTCALIVFFLGICPWLAQSLSLPQVAAAFHQLEPSPLEPASSSQTDEIKAFLRQEIKFLEEKKYQEFMSSFGTGRNLQQSLKNQGKGSVPSQPELETWFDAQRLENSFKRLNGLLGGSFQSSQKSSEVLCEFKGSRETVRTWFRKEAGKWGMAEDSYLIYGYSQKAYQTGHYQEAIRYMAEIISRGEDEPGMNYDLACDYELLGQRKEAVAALQRAVQQGYSSWPHSRFDPDLKGLRASTDWPALENRLKQNWDALLKRDAHLQDPVLFTLYKEDQAERLPQNIDWDTVTKHDEERREQVKELIKAERMRTARDHYYAALIFQHGLKPEDYLKSNELAKKAIELDPEYGSAKWLSAASMDRYLWSVGEPQIYGTQSNLVGGQWTLEPMDTKAVTDEERVRLNVPSLQQALENLKRQNERLKPESTSKR